MAFVHLAAEEEACRALEAAGLGDVPRVSDPEGAVYRGLAVGRMPWWHLLHPAMIRRAWQARRFGVGRTNSDMRRKQAAFLVDRGQVLRSWRAELASDRPDYRALAGVQRDAS
ncbi:MAG: hypothetical protein AB1758_28205 [Candidatus Eremiobacterota bacterium]